MKKYYILIITTLLLMIFYYFKDEPIKKDPMPIITDLKENNINDFNEDLVQIPEEPINQDYILIEDQKHINKLYTNEYLKSLIQYFEQNTLKLIIKDGTNYLSVFNNFTLKKNDSIEELIVVDITTDYVRFKVVNDHYNNNLFCINLFVNGKITFFYQYETLFECTEPSLTFKDAYNYLEENKDNQL
jgi:hypothetical protein